MPEQEPQSDEPRHATHVRYIVRALGPLGSPWLMANMPAPNSSLHECFDEEGEFGRAVVVVVGRDCEL